MKRHIIWGHLGVNDQKPNCRSGAYTQVTPIDLIPDGKTLDYGVGNAIKKLGKMGLKPSEVGIDLAILSILVTAADTRIERDLEGQDSWTREIDISLPVSDVSRWESSSGLLSRMLKFLTGDIWRFKFRERPSCFYLLSLKTEDFKFKDFSTVSLFSGGLDSFIGAIDILNARKKKTLFVSHYWDQSTRNQEICADILEKMYGNFNSQMMRVRVGFPNRIIAGSKTELTLRGRSFLFFALAGLAASSSNKIEEIIVPENGLISLNVPLDSLRLGAWSTRTTHPFYLARWNDLLKKLEIGASLSNPYRFLTKGEMAKQCNNKSFLQKHYKKTISCSSVGKGRWSKAMLPHCGYCVPCLIRRASITHAFQNDDTGYWGLDLTVKPVLDTQKAEGRDVRSFHLVQHKLMNPDNLPLLMVQKSGPLNDYSDKEIVEYAGVFKRGIEEVGRLLKDVTAKPL